MNIEDRSCPICLEPFEQQQICTPDICEHIFCYVCLIQWASKSIVCPLCRQIFRQINKIEKNSRIPSIKVRLLTNLNVAEDNNGDESQDELESSSSDESDPERNIESESNNDTSSNSSVSNNEEYVQRQHRYNLRPRQSLTQNWDESDLDSDLD